MRDTNAQSLIFFILILIFFLAPSLLKLLGKYTLDSKQSKGASAPAPDETFPEVDHYAMDKGDESQDLDRSQISNEPIKPRWF